MTSNMTPEHKLAISEGRTGRDKFTAKIRAAKPKGYSQNALAKALGIKPSLLSMYRTGERKIPLARAQRVQELTGWPADAAHWPGGILSDA